jgi:hypothetical protein
MCGLTVAQLEIIVLFCPILPRVGSQFAHRCQFIAIVAEIIISSPLFALRPFNSVDNPFAFQWVVVGTVLYGACASITSIVQISYLVYRIQRHHRSKRKLSEMNRDEMTWFRVSYCAILVFDILGLYIIVIPNRLHILALIPSLTLNTRVLLISYIFFRLRKMAMVKQLGMQGAVVKRGEVEEALSDGYARTQKISLNNK